MIPFSPPFEDRDSSELIAIANSKNDDWQQKAVDAAKRELIKRGITKENQDKTLEEWEEKFQTAKVEHQAWLDGNLTVGYSIFEILRGLLLLPLHLLGKGPYRESFISLKEDNFRLKIKQKLFIILFGLLIWYGIFTVSYQQYETKRLAIIEQSDISTWENNQIKNEQ